MPRAHATQPVLPSVVAAVLTTLALALTLLPFQATASIPAGRGPTMDFAKVDAGGEYGCGIKADGSLWCWGRNTWGQVGDGSRADAASPTRIGSKTDWVKVSAGGATTCAIRRGGALYCWGLNNRGQVGDGTRTVRPRPHRVKGEWKQVSAAWYNVCAIRKDGTAWCWGDNTAGQLGAGNTRSTLKKVRVHGGGKWRSVSTGGWFTCGVKTDRSMWCWGRNQFGQLGDGSYTWRSAPVRVGSGRRWAEVSTSWTHSCARTTGGGAFCWGRNGRGAVGNGTTDAVNRPQPVAGDHDATSITAFEGGSCLVDTKGRAWCWGDNSYGEVGGTAPVVLKPRLHGKGYDRVSGGWMFVCGTRAGTSARCWGNNEHRQLGGAHAAARQTPWAAGHRPTPAADGASGSRGADRPLSLRIASFNVLGEHHTGPYRDADRYAPSRMRAEWTAQAILNNGLDVVGIQEPSAAQLSYIVRASGGRLASYPSAGDHLSTETTLLWDKARYEAVREVSPRFQFIDHKLPRPQVLLRDKKTGRTFWVLAVHNAPNSHQAQRNAAVEAQLRRINMLEKGGSPVFFLGDMNEKQTILCKVLRGTDLGSAAGGRLTPSGQCVTPKSMRVDWIFGPKNATWSRFSYQRPPLVALSTDHWVPMTNVRVP